jgi:hypothetical protein
MTSGWVTFLTENGHPVYERGHRMRARWSNTLEPVRDMKDIGNNTVSFVWDLSLTRDAIDIATGSFEPLDIVMRPPNSESCFGWHNRFIQNPGPSEQDIFELPKGRYLAEVLVTTGGREFRETFRIVNDQSIDHFRLEEISSLARHA